MDVGAYCHLAFLELFELVVDGLTKMLPFHHFSPNGWLSFLYHFFPVREGDDLGGCQFL